MHSQFIVTCIVLNFTTYDKGSLVTQWRRTRKGRGTEKCIWVQSPATEQRKNWRARGVVVVWRENIISMSSKHKQRRLEIYLKSILTVEWWLIDLNEARFKLYDLALETRLLLIVELEASFTLIYIISIHSALPMRVNFRILSSLFVLSRHR